MDDVAEPSNHILDNGVGLTFNPGSAIGHTPSYFSTNHRRTGTSEKTFATNLVVQNIQITAFAAFTCFLQLDR